MYTCIKKKKTLDRPSQQLLKPFGVKITGKENMIKNNSHSLLQAKKAINEILVGTLYFLAI